MSVYSGSHPPSFYQSWNGMVVSIEACGLRQICMPCPVYGRQRTTLVQFYCGMTTRPRVADEKTLMGVGVVYAYVGEFDVRRLCNSTGKCLCKGDAQRVKWCYCYTSFEMSCHDCTSCRHTYNSTGLSKWTREKWRLT